MSGVDAAGVASGDFKVTVPHNPAAHWHQWIYPNGWRGIDPIERRDKVGRRQGKRAGMFPEWFVLACNNVDCHARAVVRVRVLTDYADRCEAALAGAAPATPTPPAPPADTGGRS